MTNHTRHIAATCAFVLGTAITLAGVDTRTQQDPKFDFTRLTTFAWNPKSPGDVRIWIAADSKSEPVKRQYEPVMIQAFEEQLIARGYTRAAGNPPDFVLTYYLLVTMGNSAQVMGQFLPAVAQWGLPLFTPQTTALKFYPEGTLVLDVASPTAESVVWRGIAAAKVDEQNTEARRTARLRDIIKDLVSKFPKRK